jgi:hypothetical protein
MVGANHSGIRVELVCPLTIIYPHFENWGASWRKEMQN